MASSFTVAVGCIGSLSLWNRYVGHIPGPIFYPLSILGLAGYRLYQWLLYPRFVSKLRDLPQPSEKPHWIWGHFSNAANRPDGTYMLDFCEENENADIIRVLFMLNSERIIPVSVQAVSQILSSQSYTFIKPPFIARSLSGVLGNGILFAEGDVHKHQRKLLMPAFSFTHVKSLVPVFLEESARLIKTINARIAATEGLGEDKSQIEVSKIMSLLTLDIIYRAGLGVQFNALENPDNELSTAYSRVFNLAGNTGRLIFLLQSLIPGSRFLPFERNRELWRARQVINKFASDAIAAKMEKYEKNGSSGPAEVDILSVMIEEGNGEWTLQGMMDQLTTFLVAGHETTASATTLALYHISKNQDVQDRLREELYTQFPGGYETIKTYNDVESLKYLNNVIREILRVVPPVVGTIRMAKEDTYVCGHFIPKGTIVNIPIGAHNKLRSAWGDDAREFNPDRWDDRQAPNAVSFLTFLHGPRSCIGRRFAELEFKSILLTLVGHFKFALKEDQVVEFRNSITYRPVGGLPLTVTPLTAW